MSYDLVILNGKAVVGGLLQKANIGVKHGKIACLSLDDLKGSQVIDANGKIVVPGAVDPHMHTWFPGYQFESFDNATKAAAKGGVTTIIDMPLDSPPTCTEDLLKKKINMTQSLAFVDYALFGGITPQTASEVEKMASHGIVGFKIFLDNAGRKGMFDGLDSGKLYETLLQVAKLDLVAAVHAENSFINEYLTNQFKARGVLSPEAWEEARPIFAEYEGVARVVLLAKETACKVNLCHLSNAISVELVHQAQTEGYQIFAETCPHYLLLDKEDLRKDKRLRCSPPLRSREEVEKLWDQVVAGKINTIGSDHAPLPKDLSKDIWEIYGGCGNLVETMVPMFLTEGLYNRKMDLVQLISLISTNPAKVYGLYPRKGVISLGADADLVILELGQENVVNAESLSMLGEKWSPFHGWVSKVRLIHTILRGEVIVEDGQVLGRSGYGQFIKKNNN